MATQALHRLPRRSNQGALKFPVSRLTWIASWGCIALTVSKLNVIAALVMIAIAVGGAWATSNGYVYQLAYHALKSLTNRLRNDGYVHTTALFPESTDSHQPSEVRLCQVVIAGESSPLSFLAANKAGADTYWFMVKPDRSAQYMDQADREAWATRWMQGLASLARNGIARLTVCQLRLPHNSTTQVEHLQSRLHASVAEPQFAKLVDSLSDSILKAQTMDDLHLVVALTIPRLLGWNTRTIPTSLTREEFNRRYISQILDSARSTLNGMGFKIREPDALELTALVQASINPAEAPQVYETWQHDLGQRGGDPERSVLLAQGLWPTDIRATDRAIQTSESWHSVMRIGFDPFLEGRPLCLGFFDAILGTPPTYGALCMHFQAVPGKGERRITEGKFQFRGNKYADRTYKPEEEEALKRSKDELDGLAYSRSSFVFRSGVLLRVSASSEEELKELVDRIRREFEASNLSCHLIRRSSRQMLALLATLGIDHGNV